MSDLGRAFRSVESECARRLTIGLALLLVACQTHGPEVSSSRFILHVLRGESNEDDFQLEFDRSYTSLTLRDGKSVGNKGVLDDATFEEVNTLVRQEEMSAYAADPNVLSGASVDDALPGSPSRPLYHVILSDDRYSPTPSFDAWIIDAPETHEATTAILRRADAIVAKAQTSAK